MEFFRNQSLGRQARSLPANTYNIIKTLLHQNQQKPVFVPVRSMQYQAIIDNEEVIFVDIHRRPFIEFAWQRFIPQRRTCLTEPVPYEFVFYEAQAIETMQRMQGEFYKFACQLYNRKHAQEKLDQQENKIIPFKLIVNKP